MQYCVDAPIAPQHGACVPPAGTVTICENTTGQFPDPNAEAPALFDGRLLAISGPSFCDGDVELTGWTLQVSYYDVEGDVGFGDDPFEIGVYHDGLFKTPREGTVTDGPTFGSEGHSGTVNFLVCVPVDTPSVAVDLKDDEGNISNGVCIVDST